MQQNTVCFHDSDVFVLHRMGLEALVESYAFWRPSLRTLTFEDIPGIPKQGIGLL